MNETSYKQEQKQNSLLPHEVLISQVPPSYDVHSTSPAMGNLSTGENLRSNKLKGIEKIKLADIGKNTCEGLNCYKSITTSIEVWAGTFGMIKLYLCANCAIRFTQKKVVQ